MSGSAILIIVGGLMLLILGGISIYSQHYSLNNMKESAAAQGIKQRIECVRDFLKSHSEKLEEYDENLTRLLIESITVYDNRLIVEFKSGTQVEIKRK